MTSCCQRSGPAAIGAATSLTILLAFLLCTATATAAAQPPCRCPDSGFQLWLPTSPCSTKCTASLATAASGEGCVLTIACRPSTSTEQAELAPGNLSALLAETAAHLPARSRRSVASLRLELNRTRVALTALNATGATALRSLFGVGGCRHQWRQPSIVVRLRKSPVLGVDPDFLDSLGSAAVDVIVEDADTVWTLNGAPIDFGNGSVASLRLEGLASPESPTVATLQNIRANSVELRLVAQAHAQHPVDFGLPTSPPPVLYLRNVRVAGCLSVEVAAKESAPKTAKTPLPSSWALALADVSAGQLRLAGHLSLARPLGRSLASLTDLSVQSGADLTGRPLLEDLHVWAPGLRRLQLAGNARLAAAALDRRQLEGLLAGRLLPRLRLLDLRAAAAHSEVPGGSRRPPPPTVAPTNLDGGRSSGRCSEIRLWVDREPVFRCDCRLGWLLTECLNASGARCTGSVGQKPVRFDSYYRTNCPQNASGGRGGFVRGEESLAFVLWVPLAALLLTGLLVVFAVLLALFNPCGARHLAEKLRSESNSSDSSAGSGNERSRPENVPRVKLLV